MSSCQVEVSLFDGGLGQERIGHEREPFNWNWRRGWR